MNDYIPRKEALAVLGEEPYVWDEDSDSEVQEYRDWECHYNAISAIPAADVVEVTRCRECIYNRGETKDLWGNPAIKCVTDVTHKPDWYCASGKRKDGGQDE